MGLIRTERIGESIFWGIWDNSAVSSEEGLYAAYPMNTEEKIEYESLNHIFRKIEWLAGRLLIKQLSELAGIHFSGTFKDDQGKCHLKENPVYISISHCRKHVVALLSLEIPAGIDIEYPTAKFSSIGPRFMDNEELAWAGNDINKICMAWCAKEALFKLIGTKGMTIGQNFRIRPSTNKGLTGIFQFGEIRTEHFLLHFRHEEWHIMIALAN